MPSGASSYCGVTIGTLLISLSSVSSVGKVEQWVYCALFRRGKQREPGVDHSTTVWLSANSHAMNGSCRWQEACLPMPGAKINPKQTPEMNSGSWKLDGP